MSHRRRRRTRHWSLTATIERGRQSIPRWAVNKRLLLIRQSYARASHFFGHILHFRLAIVNVQHGFLVVHVHARLKSQLWNHRSVDVHKAHGRMIREQMPTAMLAPLAIADRRLVVSADASGTARYPECLRLPQCKRVNWSCRPLAARFAVTVPHRHRLARDLKLHLATKAAACVDLFIAHGPIYGRLPMCKSSAV